jgi:hypothetical protein
MITQSRDAKLKPVPDSTIEAVRDIMTGRRQEGAPFAGGARLRKRGEWAGPNRRRPDMRTS